MKLLTGKKYHSRLQDSCESVLKWPVKVGGVLCVLFFLLLSNWAQAQTCPGAPLSVSHNNNQVTACSGYNPASIDAVVVGGIGPFAYQWYDNGSPITDSTRSSLDLQQLSTGNHSYYVVVTDN